MMKKTAKVVHNSQDQLLALPANLWRHLAAISRQAIRSTKSLQKPLLRVFPDGDIPVVSSSFFSIERFNRHFVYIHCYSGL